MLHPYHTVACISPSTSSKAHLGRVAPPMGKAKPMGEDEIRKRRDEPRTAVRLITQ